MEIDINSTCRLCMYASDEFVCIFDEETFEMPAEIVDLFETFQIMIYNNPNKPSIMCMKCYAQLTLFRQFRSKCEQSEQQWNELAGVDEPEQPESQEQDTELVEQMNVDFIEEVEMEEIEVEAQGEYGEDRQIKVLAVKRHPGTFKSPKKVKKAKTDPEDLDAMERAFVEKERGDRPVTDEDLKLQEFYGFYCPICENKQRMDSLTTYKYHMRVRHDQRDAAVSCCNKKLSKRYQLVDHMAYHSEPDRLACEFCEKVYSDRKSLAAHIKRKHTSYEERKYQCDYCLKRFVGYEPMRQHVLTHLSEEAKEQLRTHLCNECGMTFMHKHILQNHIKYVHLKIGLVCDLCGKHFKSKFDYQLHRRNAHGEEGPAREQCPICKNWYSNEKAVREHIRYLHERTEKIRCTICGEELSSKQSLRSHTKLKHQEKMHRCSYCDKALPTQIRLKEHEAMHTGVSLYTCKYCTKEFNMKSNMYKHLKAMHPNEWTREKEYKSQNPENHRNAVQDVQNEVVVQLIKVE
ncbi:gastrula zinc finger protein XlCGF26.1-like [Culicoides brevitarsis]|uniref:gastrula zinc finger protein XlCGF26.1-like n=1 Tax=Culicoides brevitarsis TaxID=469753 RepID=UPI00307C8D8F